MATNVTVFPVENVCVVYLQDGSSYTIEPQKTHSFQLVDNGFCTISETVSAEEGEHPPEAFIDAMILFWDGMRKLIKNEIEEPEVNPL